MITISSEGRGHKVTVNMNLGANGLTVRAADAREALLAAEHHLDAARHRSGNNCPICREESRRRRTS